MFILSPFLYKSSIIEYFKLPGKIPNDMALITYVGLWGTDIRSADF